MSTPTGQRARSARHQIPIAMTRALTHYKAQGMSLEKIYIKLYNTSSRGTARLHNKQGILYTSLSRCMKPAINLLIEYFKPDVLDAIANGDAMKAMQQEFTELERKATKTEIWAKPLVGKFKRLFEKAQHCRRATATKRSIPLPPEKAIGVIMQPSKTHKTPINENASVRDFHNSRGQNTPPVQTSTSKPSNRKRKRARGTRRPKRNRSDRSKTRTQQSKRPRTDLSHMHKKIVQKIVKELCEDTVMGNTEFILSTMNP